MLRAVPANKPRLLVQWILLREFPNSFSQTIASVQGLLKQLAHFGLFIWALFKRDAKRTHPVLIPLWVEGAPGSHPLRVESGLIGPREDKFGSRDSIKPIKLELMRYLAFWKLADIWFGWDSQVKRQSTETEGSSEVEQKNCWDPGVKTGSKWVSNPFVSPPLN